MSDDRESRADIEHRVARMQAAVIYRRLKAIVDGWEREERAKKKVALHALAWLAGIWAITIPVGWLSGGGLLLSLFFGFVFWVLVVITLMREHFSRR
jgi:membrane protein CcdC involved in cytochrome C biogenesis